MSAAPKTQYKVQQDKGISKLFSRMTKVHEVNRKHDHALSVRVDELRQKEHMERVRRYSDVRVLQRTLSEMRMEKSRMTHTFTPEEIDNDEVAPVMSWRKIQLKRFQNQPRVRQRRRSNAAQTLLTVTDKTEFTAKNKFRSAVMAVCLSKALSKIPEKNKMNEATENQTVQIEKNTSDSTINWITQLKQANEEKPLLSTHSPNKIESIDSKNDAEKCEPSRPETSETERLSQVLDILKNSSVDQSKSSWARPSAKKVNPVPTFGQLHPARRSSLPRRPGDPIRRRPSTSDNTDIDSSQFFMDKTGTVRRLSRPTIKDDIDEQGSRGLRSQSSSDPGSTRGTPRTCKVYSADSSRWDILNDATSSKNGPVSSSLERKRSELMKRDKDVMERLRKFLDSTMP